jgi:hypothetical protein
MRSIGLKPLHNNRFLPKNPFAFPHISEEKEDGSQIVTYPPQLTEALLEDLYDSHTTRKRQATDSQGKDKGRKKYQKIDYSKVIVNVKW